MVVTYIVLCLYQPLAKSASYIGLNWMGQSWIITFINYLICWRVLESTQNSIKISHIPFKKYFGMGFFL